MCILPSKLISSSFVICLSLATNDVTSNFGPNCMYFWVRNVFKT